MRRDNAVAALLGKYWLTKESAGSDAEAAEKRAECCPTFCGLFLHIEQFRRDAHRTPEKIRVDIVRITQRIEASQLLANFLVSELNLVRLRLVGERLRFFAAQLCVEHVEPSIIVGARDAIGSGFAQ